MIVNGDHSNWNRDDVSKAPAGGRQGGICLTFGQLEVGSYAGSTRIENSLIHDRGLSTNRSQGIYVQATSGRTLIRNNWIFRNGDRGIQLDPAASNVVVTHNVIDGNGSGVIFSGDGTNMSSDNTVVGVPGPRGAIVGRG